MNNTNIHTYILNKYIGRKKYFILEFYERMHGITIECSVVLTKYFLMTFLRRSTIFNSVTNWLSMESIEIKIK